jgi:predicted HD phosphohydrolase
MDIHEREVHLTMRTLPLLAYVHHDGQVVDQLTHALQTATRLRRGGGDDELVTAGLLHDVGKLWHEVDHADVAVAILRGRVRAEVLEALHFHADARGGRHQVRSEESRLLLAADEDSVDDAGYDADPLESFVDPLRAVFCP